MILSGNTGVEDSAGFLAYHYQPQVNHSLYHLMSFSQSVIHDFMCVFFLALHARWVKKQLEWIFRIACTGMNVEASQARFKCPC